MAKLDQDSTQNVASGKNNPTWRVNPVSTSAAAVILLVGVFLAMGIEAAGISTNWGIAWMALVTIIALNVWFSLKIAKQWEKA
ncbi:MAG TPA: hypothetical protein VLS48_04225, partial [Anaerolineales bacterium]|nr:hypothetical protein [Anaerolineales bacterium]